MITDLKLTTSSPAASSWDREIPSGCPCCGALPCDWAENPLRAGSASAREEALRERDRARRIATDRQYMIDALAQMLGEKGRRVWAAWQRKGVVRIHTAWTEEAASLTGEEIAQLHLDMEAARENATPIDDVDEHLTALAQPQDAAPEPAAAHRTGTGAAS